MKTLIFTNHSEGTPHQSLADLLRPNKQAYAKLHGYDFEDMDTSYDPDGHLIVFEALKDRLTKYDTVMMVGADVMFMNQTIGLETFNYAPLTIARERLNWWPINSDVAIWRRRIQMLKNEMGTYCGMTIQNDASTIIDRLIQDADIWTQYPWLWQNHLWNLMCKEPWIKASVNIVEANRMNSTLQQCPSAFQLGDFILHLLDMTIEQKIEKAKMMLPFVGDGSYYPPKV